MTTEVVRQLKKAMWNRIPKTVSRRFLESYIRYNSRRNGGIVRNTIQPSQVLWVDPTNIIHSVAWEELEEKHLDFRPGFLEHPRFKLAGTVRDGDWDQIDRRFNDCIVHRSFIDHFRRGVPWDETELYQQVANRIESGEQWWRCGSEEEFNERCSQLDDLYNQLKTDGFKTQRELAFIDNAPLANRGASSTDPVSVIYGEIALHVSRKGEWIFHDGRNRLSMAKIIGLDRVPIVVLVRHREWQKFRRKIAAGQTDMKDFEHHPDLQVLTTNESLANMWKV